MGKRQEAFALALLALAIGGCPASYPNRPSSDFSLRDMAKTDIDRVAEIHLRGNVRSSQNLDAKTLSPQPG